MSSTTCRTSTSELRPSLWWFGLVFFLERFVRFYIFMGVLWFDWSAMLAMIWGANSRPDDRRLMFWMRALMVWCVAITIANLYYVARVPELEQIAPEKQAFGRLYLMAVLSVKLAWSSFNLYHLWKDNRSSQSSSA